MPWFDVLSGALGQANPYDEARTWADEAQRRNRAAVGLDANGNPLPAGPAAPAAPDPNNPVNNGQSVAMGQALASGVQQPGQQPNATKTDPSLGHILMDMTQYQQREQGFNQAMGAGFAAVSQPRDREWVSKIFNVNEPDATKLIQQTQDLASQQQGQDRMNSIGAMLSGPQGLQIANALNMPGSTPAEKIAALQAAYRADPQSISKMITSMQAPTDDLKNIEQLTTLLSSKPGFNQSDLESIKKAVFSKIGGPQAEQMISDQIAFRQKFGHDPSWKDNPDAYKSYIAQQGARTEAMNIRSTSENKVNELEYKIGRIRNDKALPGLMKRLVPGQGILSLVGYNDAERNLLQEIKQATSDEYVRGLADPGLGTRKTQQEMQYVGQSLGGVLNASNINYDDYITGLEHLKDQLYETHADIYGQSGDLRGLDSKYHGFVNDVYRPGGALGEGVEGAPTRKPLDDKAKKFFANEANGSVDERIRHLRNMNYDTSGLQQ